MRTKRWDTFYNKAMDIIGGEFDFDCYFKEKYGRFDTSYWGNKPGVQDKLFELEAESEKCCQRCAKHRYQIRTDWGRIEHWCIPCYIYLCCYRIIMKIKNKLKV